MEFFANHMNLIMGDYLVKSFFTIFSLIENMLYIHAQLWRLINKRQ